MTVWTRSKARPVVGRRSEELCEIDGFRPAESLSHRIAVARGGTWAPSDLVHTCGDGRFGIGCHGWLEDHPTWAGEGGWHIRRDPRTPSEVPVFLRTQDLPIGGWFLLDECGEREPVHADDFGLPDVPEHLPYELPRWTQRDVDEVASRAAERLARFQSGRPLATTPWTDPR